MNDLDYLKIAIEQAKISVEKGGFPAGAIVVKDTKIISRGISIGFLLNDPTSHADTASLREACKLLKTSNLSGATLYDSLEPCLMCFSVGNWSGISRIVYGCRKTAEMVDKKYYEGNCNIEDINGLNSRKIDITYLPDFEPNVLSLIKKWEEQFK